MKMNITYRNLREEEHEATRHFLEQQITRHLNPHIESFNPELRQLHATIEQRKHLYHVSLRLHLPPRKLLVAQAEKDDLRGAIQHAVADLARQAERHHARISGREAWKRKSRRERIRKMKAARTPVEAPTDSHEVILARLLPRLESYIRHELTYLRANGDLLDDYPTVSDIRDEAFLRLESEADIRDADEDKLYRMLLKHVVQILHEEVEKTREHANDVSLESRAPETPEEQAEEMVEEEINEFYQPDEVLHIEDLIPDTHVVTPEQQAEAERLDSSYNLLASFPIVWRRVVMLVHREGLSPEDVARDILRTDTATILNILEHAEAFIQAHLEAKGVAPKPLSSMLKQLPGKR